MDQQNTKPTTDNGTPDIVVLKFADSKLPVFKEVKNKDYISYGEDNKYHLTLLRLFDNSSKHGAIVQGKADYVAGQGLKRRGNQEAKSPIVNRMGESQDAVFKKAILDRQIYGGFRLIIIWDVTGRSFEIYHSEYHKWRTGKEKGTYFYKEDWTDYREEPKIYSEFDTHNRSGAQVFVFNEYRPGAKYYPLPEYVSCTNYIECDIETSIFNLATISNGMFPSKMFQFFDGDPGEEGKKEIERKWNKKFGGSGNAGKFILVFGKSKEKSIQVDDLSATEIDKLYTQLNKTSQEEIFMGHRVTSPLLFGIKTEGQLGGTTELKTAYEIFINTYAKPRQKDIEEIVNNLDILIGGAGDFYTEQLDPIGLIIDIGSVIDKLPAKFLFEKLNIPKEYWPAETQMEGEGSPGVNEHIKGLTGRQFQQMQRIVKQYNQGKLTREQAASMLKSGYGLTDADVDIWLGVDETAQFSSQKEDEIIQLFSEAGDLKDGYEVVKSKPVKFSSLDEAFDDELDTHLAFAALPTTIDSDILNLINKDKRITPEVIADTLKVEAGPVAEKIQSLIDKGYIQANPVTIGQDTQIERVLTKPLPEIKKDLGVDGGGVQIVVKYSYEGPNDSKNRPFCKRMLELNRYYSRAEIEKISERLGYSVFDRRGGFWNKGNGVTSPSCRHRWESHVLVKKGGNK